MDSVSMGGVVQMTNNQQLITEFDLYVADPEYDITVMLPTRGRGKLSEKSLYTLIDLAKDNTRIEYLIALDEDDAETIKYYKDTVVPRFKKDRINFNIWVVKPLGYARLNEYVNYLGAKSNGRWMMFWNDDAVMKSRDWDRDIMSYDGQFRVLRMRDNHKHPYAIFPIVPRAWYHVLGTLSTHQMSDAQISQIAYMCDIMVNIDTECFHDRFDLTGNNNDETFNNRPQLEGNPNNPADLNSPETIIHRHRQVMRVMWYLKTIDDYNDHYEMAIKGKGELWDKLEANDEKGLTSRFSYNKEGKYVKQTS